MVWRPRSGGISELNWQVVSIVNVNTRETTDSLEWLLPIVWKHLASCLALLSESDIHGSSSAEMGSLAIDEREWGRE